MARNKQHRSSRRTLWRSGILLLYPGGKVVGVGSASYSRTWLVPWQKVSREGSGPSCHHDVHPSRVWPRKVEGEQCGSLARANGCASDHWPPCCPQKLPHQYLWNKYNKDVSSPTVQQGRAESQGGQRHPGRTGDQWPLSGSRLEAWGSTSPHTDSKWGERWRESSACLRFSSPWEHGGMWGGKRGRGTDVLGTRIILIILEDWNSDDLWFRPQTGETTTSVKSDNEIHQC